MSKLFEISAQFSPTGDQPEAIKALVSGLSDGLAGETLLGVTGSGKTFTIANVIQAVFWSGMNWQLPLFRRCL